MKTTGINNNDFTYAQIEPLKTTSNIFKSLGKYILTSVTFLVMLFLSTSYVDEKSATYDLHNEFYSLEMHNGLSSALEANSCRLLTEKAGFNAPHLIYEMYVKNGYKPIWTINNRLNSSAVEVIELLNKAEYYGLNRSSYHVDQLNRLYDNILKTSHSDSLLMLRQDLEVLLSDACLYFMVHLHRGIISTDSLLNDNFSSELTAYLFKSVKHQNVTDKILALQPDNLHYRNLQKALEKFLNKVNLNDEIFEIPEPAKDLIKSYNAAKPVLIKLGYLTESTRENDTSIIKAIKEFQKYHGLRTDGILNKNTCKAMSMSSRERFLKIALNLDRLRKDVNYKNDDVFVNIPAYQLRVVRANQVKRTFNVVVGRPHTPTPELTSKIEKIVTIPEWNVPKSITLNEILPKVKKDSSYLVRNNFKVIDKQLNEVSINEIEWKEMTKDDFDYYFVQNSGNSNALGLLKFTFNNPYHIYIHDTPSKKYFNEDIRAYSHGCVRLQDPDQFASYLVENWVNSEQKPDINNLVTKRIHKDIVLSEPIDIHIRYLTCEADENLNLYFYKDIYNRDETSIKLLFN
jgi:murein L,D-transpeptidase YcbB/YkuD